MSDAADDQVRERGDRLDRAAKSFTLHLLWIVPLVVVPIAFFVRAFHDLFQSEAIAAAQTAREIVRGHGFATLWAYPIELALKAGHFPRPELTQAPLQSMVLAAAFGAFSASDKVAALVSLVFLIVTGLVLFRMADRVFGRTAAVLAVLFLVLGLQTLVLAVSGRGDTLAMFLVTLGALLLYREPCPPGRAAAAGAVLALAYLTDYSTLALLLPLGLFAFFSAPERRWGRLAALVVAFLVVAAPWWVRNLRVTGDPFFSMRRYWVQMFSVPYPGFTVARATDTSALGVWAFVAAHPLSFVRKIVMALRSLHGAVPATMGVYIVAFFLAGILHPLQDGRARLLRKCLYLALALEFLLAAMQNGDVGFLTPLLPLVLVFAVGFFVHLLGRLESRAARGWAVALFLALAGYPTLVGLVAPGATGNASRPNLEALGKFVPADVVVVSDIPWSVAWYGDRPAVMLPLEQDDFAFVRQRNQVGAVYLSSRIRAWPPQEQPRPWQMMTSLGLKGFVPAWAPSEHAGEVLLVRQDLAQAGPAGPTPPPEGSGAPGGPAAAPEAPQGGLP